MKTKIKGMEILIAAMLLLITAIFLVPAATATTVETSDASASPGNTTTTTVTAYEVENLGNFGITVTFDPDVVNVGALYESDGTKIDAVDAMVYLVLHYIHLYLIYYDRQKHVSAGDMQVNIHIKNTTQEILTFD